MDVISKLFVDTSAWCAVFDRRDQNHQEAADLLSSLKGKPVRLITSDYVFDETVTLLRARAGHSSAVVFGERLLKGSVAIEEIDTQIQTEAWDLFVTYEDLDCSFTDCTSFALMRNHRLEHAFTFDRHFWRMGFVCHPNV